MNYFDEVKKIINEYKIVREQVLNDGTILVGKAPHVAPQAWLHKIFPVLNNEEMALIEKQTALIIPDSYSYFLTHYSNRLKIFIDTMHLDGLRKEAGRNIENAWQPYSIFIPNSGKNQECNAASFFYRWV